jgi:hypothetical protein
MHYVIHFTRPVYRVTMCGFVGYTAGHGVFPSHIVGDYAFPVRDGVDRKLNLFDVIRVDEDKRGRVWIVIFEGLTVKVPKRLVVKLQCKFST